MSVNSVKADWQREEREKSVTHGNLADFVSMLCKPMPLFECQKILVAEGLAVLASQIHRFFCFLISVILHEYLFLKREKREKEKQTLLLKKLI